MTSQDNSQNDSRELTEKIQKLPCRRTRPIRYSFGELLTADEINTLVEYITQRDLERERSLLKDLVKNGVLMEFHARPRLIALERQLKKE